MNGHTQQLKGIDFHGKAKFPRPHPLPHLIRDGALASPMQRDVEMDVDPGLASGNTAVAIVLALRIDGDRKRFQLFFRLAYELRSVNSTLVRVAASNLDIGHQLL